MEGSNAQNLGILSEKEKITQEKAKLWEAKDRKLVVLDR